MVDAVAHEDFRPPVVHAHGDGDHEGAPRVAKADVGVVIELQALGHAIELSHRGAVHLGFEFGHVGHHAGSFARWRSTARVCPSSG